MSPPICAAQIADTMICLETCSHWPDWNSCPLDAPVTSQNKL